MAAGRRRSECVCVRVRCECMCVSVSVCVCVCVRGVSAWCECVCMSGNLAYMYKCMSVPCCYQPENPPLVGFRVAVLSITISLSVGCTYAITFAIPCRKGMSNAEL